MPCVYDMKSENVPICPSARMPPFQRTSARANEEVKFTIPEKIPLIREALTELSFIDFVSFRNRESIFRSIFRDFIVFIPVISSLKSLVICAFIFLISRFKCSSRFWNRSIIKAAKGSTSMIISVSFTFIENIMHKAKSRYVIWLTVSCMRHDILSPILLTSLITLEWI